MESMKNSFILLIASIAILFIFSVFQPINTCTASGVTIYVDDNSGPGINYTKIQDAINAANEGDTIYIYSGNYNENIVIDKTLVLMGEDRDSTIITGVSDNEVTLAIKGNVVEYISDVSVSGLKILQNPTAVSNEYANIYIEYARECTITGCIIKDGFNGIRAKQTDESTISGNTIENNQEDGFLLFISSDKNEIKNNVIQNNKRGIYLQDFCTENTIATNDISGNSNQGILIMGGSDNNVIYHNDFENGNKNANDECSNAWDDGSEGNYWADYTGTDSDGNGIGDTPYDIPSSGNQDLYPLGYFSGSNQQPVAAIQSISPNPAIEGQTVSFNGYGADYDGSIVAWEWRVDGVTVSPVEDFSSSRFSAGTHSVTFRVQDNDLYWSQTVSNTFTITDSDQQNNPPTATIVYPQLSAIAIYGEPVRFYGIGQDQDQDDIVSYSWSSSINDYFSGEPSFYKSDLPVGEHTITLRVTDNHGAYAETSQTLVINPDPNVENNLPVAVTGGPYTGVINSSVSFDGSNSYDPDEDDSITDYSWDFGDGAKGSGATADHTYSISGEYTVQLTVTDSHGEQSVSTVIVSISSESNNGQNGGNGSSDDKDDKWIIPGFKLGFIIIIIAIGFFIFWKRIKKK